MQNADKTARFWDQIADKYSRRPVADEEAYEIKLQITREYLNPKSRLLEFGCGTGSTALRHAPLVDHIDALDISENMIAIARAKADDAKISNVDFTVASIEDFAAEKAPYDAVLGHSILHLVDDRKAILAKSNQLLKRGGVFISSTACLGDSQKWMGLVLPIVHGIGVAPRVQVFKQETLIEEHLAAGFEVIHQWQPNKGAAVFLVARKIAEASH